MDIHELVELQRTALLASGPRHAEERIDQLDALHSTIRQRENLICDALQADLGKRPEEAYMTDIGMVLSELSFIINVHYGLDTKHSRSKCSRGADSSAAL